MIENHILALQMFAQQKHLWKLGVIQPPRYKISELLNSVYRHLRSDLG